MVIRACIILSPHPSFFGRCGMDIDHGDTLRIRAISDIKSPGHRLTMFL